MTLTVRLKPELESALELHCAERGVTKSLVVQEVLAAYLARPPRRKQPQASVPDLPAQPSANYLAFERLGLIGAGTHDGRSATKEVVRERIRESFERKRARRA
jgi:hypothetical protein